MIKHSTICSLCVWLISTSTPAGPDKADLVVGSERDAHGCIASAGYLWSTVQNRCIRLFETGLAFTPEISPDKAPVHLAYLVLPPAYAPIRQVELFLPGEIQPISLITKDTPESDVRPVLLTSEAHDIRLLRVKDAYILEVRGQRFWHTISQNDR